VRKKVSFAALLFAWLCAIGALWDVAQVVAWGRMFADYSRVLSVSDALAATFDPALRCHLCESISAAKQAGKDQDPAIPVANDRQSQPLVLVCDLPAPIIFADIGADWSVAAIRHGPVRTEPVPLPPPRV